MDNSEAMSEIKHIELPIDKIILLDENPRDIKEADLQKLAKDIESDPTFLHQRPSLINLVDGKYICYAGSQRIKAQKLLGYKTAICFVQENVPDKLQNERMLKDNLHRGVWNQDKLLDLDFELFELKEFGFEDFQLNVFTDDVELEEDDFQVVLPAEPRTKPGDLYELGKHRLLCGDSTSSEDVAKLMNNEKAQLIFTDPPYNVDYKSASGNSYDSTKYGGTGGQIFNDNKTDEDATEFYTAVLKNLYEYSTDNCPIYWWYASRNYHLNHEAFIRNNWHISQNVIWIKENMVFGQGQDFHRCYEPVLFGWKKGNKHFVARGINNLKDVFTLNNEDYRDGFQELLDVWYEKRDNTNTYVHPTQKPIRLAERALKKHSLRKFIVLDLFGGSGSTLLGCEQSNRCARLMELDPKYNDVIVKRYVSYCKSKGISYLVKLNGVDISNESWLT